MSVVLQKAVRVSAQLRCALYCWLIVRTCEVAALFSEEHKQHISSLALGRNLLMAMQMLPQSVA